MSFADEIALKRKEATDLRASQDTHRQSLDAIKGSGVEVVGALQGTAKTADMQQIIQELRQIQFDTLMSAQQQSHAVAKPSVILTDQTDLGDKIAELADKFENAIKQLDTSKNDADEIAQLKQLNKTLQEYIKAKKSEGATENKVGKALLVAIKSLKMSPVVNVPQPKVAVTTQHIDLQPLQNTIREYFKQGERENFIDLNDYHAHDIDNSNPKMQYIGFLNPRGNWYIIENDMTNNALRYVFGSDDYETAFKRAPSYSYNLLSEAISALST